MSGVRFDGRLSKLFTTWREDTPCTSRPHYTTLILSMVLLGCGSGSGNQGATTIDPQPNESTQMTNQEIVIKFLGGFNDPTKFQQSLELLADDYKFKNPIVELKSKVEFIALAKEISAVITGLTIIRTSAEKEWVATYYVFKSSLPGLESTYGSEWFRLEDGKIKESHLIYDTSKWQKVYEQMEN